MLPGSARCGTFAEHPGGTVNVPRYGTRHDLTLDPPLQRRSLAISLRTRPFTNMVCTCLRLNQERPLAML